MSFPFTPAEFLATIPAVTDTPCQAIRKAWLIEPKKIYDLIAFMISPDGSGLTNPFLDMIYDVGDYKQSLRDDLDDNTTPNRPWLVCQGGEFLSSDFPVLAAKIGSQFDAAFGAPSALHTRLPDFRGRMFLPVSASPAHAIGEKGGEETHTLTAAEGRFLAHRHVFGNFPNAGNDDGQFLYTTTTSFTPAQDAKTISGNTDTETTTSLSEGNFVTAPSGPTAGADPHNNMPPFLVGGFVYIKT